MMQVTGFYRMWHIDFVSIFTKKLSVINQSFTQLSHQLVIFKSLFKKFLTEAIVPFFKVNVMVTSSSYTDKTRSINSISRFLWYIRTRHMRIFDNTKIKTLPFVIKAGVKIVIVVDSNEQVQVRRLFRRVILPFNIQLRWVN